MMKNIALGLLLMIGAGGFSFYMYTEENTIHITAIIGAVMGVFVFLKGIVEASRGNEA